MIRQELLTLITGLLETADERRLRIVYSFISELCA